MDNETRFATPCRGWGLRGCWCRRAAADGGIEGALLLGGQQRCPGVLHKAAQIIRRRACAVRPVRRRRCGAARPLPAAPAAPAPAPAPTSPSAPPTAPSSSREGDIRLSARRLAVQPTSALGFGLPHISDAGARVVRGDFGGFGAVGSRLPEAVSGRRQGRRLARGAGRGCTCGSPLRLGARPRRRKGTEPRHAGFSRPYRIAARAGARGAALTPSAPQGFVKRADLEVQVLPDTLRATATLGDQHPVDAATDRAMKVGACSHGAIPPPRGAITPTRRRRWPPAVPPRPIACVCARRVTGAAPSCPRRAWCVSAPSPAAQLGGVPLPRPHDCLPPPVRLGSRRLQGRDRALADRRVRGRRRVRAPAAPRPRRPRVRRGTGGGLHPAAIGGPAAHRTRHAAHVRHTSAEQVPDAFQFDTSAFVSLPLDSRGCGAALSP